MKAQAEKVIEALKAAGMEDVELMDFKPGEALPIMYTDGTEMFTLELNVA
jgi:hypothetical protein